MTFTWQHKRNDYSVDAKRPLVGDSFKLGDIVNIRTSDEKQFELCIINIEDEIFECEVLQVIKDKE
jgi:hypothetical protein